MWRWWEAAEPTEQCSTVSLACFLLYLTHSNTSYISHLIYNRARLNSQHGVFAISLPPVWSLSGSLITLGSIKLMSLFVQFLKTYGPVSARGSAFCFHLELRADGRRVGSHQTSLTNPPSCLMLIFCWCRKGGIMKYFMANFNVKLWKPTRLFSPEILV